MREAAQPATAQPGAVRAAAGAGAVVVALFLFSAIEKAVGAGPTGLPSGERMVILRTWRWMKLFSAAVQQHDHARDDKSDRPPLPKKRPDLRDEAEIRQEKKNTHYNEDQSTETGSHRPFVSC